MTINVSVGNKSTPKVTVGLGNTINTSIISKKTVTLETLSDVDTDDVQDGYTLAYNTATNKWEAVDPASELNLGIIDGGTF
jgi:hypothetical protein